MKRVLTAVGVIGLALIALVSVRRQNSGGSGDADVIEQLRLAGSDLTKPHPIDFYLYLPSQKAAERVAAVLSAEGFETKIEPPQAGAGWLTLASKQLVPTSAALAQLQRELAALAERENGEYDGWEATVVR